jgi:uncharacterized protein (DUF2249 family)
VSAEPDVVDALTRVLVRACRALAEAGEPRRAGVLAADGWVAVRHTYARQAGHLDGAMHHIARLEEQHEHRRRHQVRTPAPSNEETAMSTVPGHDRELDVRSAEPRRRHELIFETFIGLPVGQSYILVNDHDPKPLRYQFEAENAGEFSWEYLEQGPDVWRVRIGRTGTASTSGA